MSIPKSAYKIKIGEFFCQVTTLLRKYVFFHFHGFTDFERALTLLLVKIFLNFENGKKAM
jgi:hypothetical protein